MPTALELTRDGWKPYLEGARRSLAQSQIDTAPQEETALLMEKIHKAASVLKSRFGVRRVFLFGSLAYPSSFSEDSDIDLAVEGLKDADYWKAWQSAEEVIADRPVDFVEIETARPSLREAILDYGIEL